MTLRPALPSDLAALIDLENSSFSGDRMSRRSWRHAIDASSAAVLVAVLDDGSLGACAVIFFRRGSATARIYSIAVAAAARGQGLGRRLVAAAEEHARQRRCRAMKAEIRLDNTASRALFAACGYQEIGRRRSYYEDGEDAVLVRKESL